MRGFWVLGALIGAACIGSMNACVGDDPPVSDEPVVEAGAASSSSSSGATDDDSGDDAAEGDFGVFLTSLTYDTSFLSGKSYDERVTHSDELCTKAAHEAGVVRADAYRAFLAVGSTDAENDNDATRILSQTTGDGRWCALRQTAAGMTPHCSGLDVVFATPASFVNGPTAALLTDEHGTYVEPGATSTKILSGLLLDRSNVIHVVNCTGWSRSNDEDSGVVVPDAGPEDVFGYGITAPAAPGDGPYEWVTQRDFCLRQRMRLMCIEKPLRGDLP